jgi:subtilisin-like proprotein convertase family protein
MNLSKVIFTVTVVFLLLFNTHDSYAQMFWNQACSFAGSNSSYVAVRDAAELDITGSFTMEAWVNPTNVASPSFQIIMQKRNAGADGYTLYLSNGKIAIRTGGTTRLTGTVVIPNNSWSHIAGTYNSPTNTFSIYVDGVIDTSAVIAGAAPTANADSLWIGKGSNSPFNGQMDEVRIWNKALNSSEIYDYRRTSLGSSTGPYSGLVLSLTFQDNDASGTAFNLSDWSGNGNTGFNRGVTASDLSNRPLTTIQTNDCIELGGSDDYLAGPDNAGVSPTTQLTLSAWIYLRSYANSIIIHKGAPTGGASTNYRLAIVNRKLSAGINGNFNFTSNDTVPLNQWCHVAFTYYALLGSYQFHINGDLVYQGTNAAGNITDGTDSLYIGGSGSLIDFDGYIDEVRIIPDVEFTETINRFMFKSIDLSNGGAGSYAIYNLDGYAYNNGGSTTPILRFNGDGSGFAHCGSVNDQPQSPMNRADDVNFQNGFQMKKSFKRIPGSGFSGTIVDTFKILQNVSISDINVFVALNHNEEHELEISLIAPNGDIAQVYNNNNVVTNADHLTTIFDDQADSSIVNGRYVSMAPRIKPSSNINSVFGGDNSAGNWRLAIRDIAVSGVSDTGMLFCWGIQINNQSQKPYILNTENMIQGFYNASTNNMIRDTMRYYLRNTQLPYGIYDSTKAYLTNQGFAQLAFTNVSGGVAYYLQLRHRNSIETWSYPLYYDPLSFQAQYSFLNPVTQAYGSNMIQVDNLPVRFAIYGGDVNRSGDVDATDLALIDNDAYNFASGYIQTDITGDLATDGSDYAIADNNATNFVSAILPPGAEPVQQSNGEQLTQDQASITADPSLGVNSTSDPGKRERPASEKLR